MAQQPAAKNGAGPEQQARLLLWAALLILIVALLPALLDEELGGLAYLALPAALLILLAAIAPASGLPWAHNVVPALAALLPLTLALAQFGNGEIGAALVFLLVAAIPIAAVPIVLVRHTGAARWRDIRPAALAYAALSLLAVLIPTLSFNYAASWLAILALAISLALVLGALLIGRSWARWLHWLAMAALAITVALALIGSNFAVTLTPLFGQTNSLGFLLVLIAAITLLEASALLRSNIGQIAAILALLLLTALSFLTLASGDFYGWPYLVAIELVILLLVAAFSLLTTPKIIGN